MGVYLPCISNHFLEWLSSGDEGNEHEKHHHTHHRVGIGHLGWIDDNLSTTYIFDIAIQHESPRLYEPELPCNDSVVHMLYNTTN